MFQKESKQEVLTTWKVQLIFLRMKRIQRWKQYSACLPLVMINLSISKKTWFFAKNAMSHEENGCRRSGHMFQWCVHAWLQKEIGRKQSRKGKTDWHELQDTETQAFQTENFRNADLITMIRNQRRLVTCAGIMRESLTSSGKQGKGLFCLAELEQARRFLHHVLQTN